ncbi:hypothetical protein HPP92_007378 [Vanilla planifolia]|uniref:Uncharacterized protein n=1 Tax=Vanilla planifolia TaxID=51239 RepID=A0A835RMA2_VANPL|nr:hypothetical protein HPP92_007378 [Vanilla planifolia]
MRKKRRSNADKGKGKGRERIKRRDFLLVNRRDRTQIPDNRGYCPYEICIIESTDVPKLPSFVDGIGTVVGVAGTVDADSTNWNAARRGSICLNQ